MSIIIKKTIQAGVLSVLALGSVFAVAGCSAEVGQTAEEANSASEALCTGNKVYGSDTLAPVIAAAFTPYILPVMTYAGTGSGNGELALHGSTGPCGTNRQLFAPMSKDLTPGTGACTSGTDVLKSQRVGKDGILALVPTSNTETNITTANLALAFCKTATAPTVAGTCSGTITINGHAYNQFYRRDAVSGTTDTFLKLLGCNTLCTAADNANYIEVQETGQPDPRPAACAAADTATQCISKAVQANAGAIGYAGLSALTASPTAKALSVNGVAESVTTIQNGTYPLSRFLYVNHNPTMFARTTAPAGADPTNATKSEKKFLCENLVGPTVAPCPSLGLGAMTDKRAAFENSLVSLGDFVKCSATGSPFNCSTTGLTCP